MKHLLQGMLMVITIGAGALMPTAAKSATPKCTTTVFGKGAEIHLRPSYGVKGTRVQVVGLGFKPGVPVVIRYGVPNAEYMPTPLARVAAGRNGTFRTSFLAPGAAKPSLTPYIIGAIGGQSFATTSYITTPA